LLVAINDLDIECLLCEVELGDFLFLTGLDAAVALRPIIRIRIIGALPLVELLAVPEIAEEVIFPPTDQLVSITLNLNKKLLPNTDGRAVTTKDCWMVLLKSQGHFERNDLCVGLPGLCDEVVDVHEALWVVE
jgi:hypothetical protein